MAKPSYAAARGGFNPGDNHRFGGGGRGSSAYSGHTPPYAGGTQPARDGTFLGWFSDGTPVYLVPPSGAIQPKE